MTAKPTYDELEKRLREFEQAELQRKNDEKALMESDMLYRFLVENSNDLIWTFDLSSMTYTYCSKSVERVLGYSQDEVVGTTLDDIFFPEMKKKVMSVFAGVLTDKSHSNQILMEAEHRRKDGTTVWMEINAVLNRDALNQPLSFTGVSRDITERLITEEALRHSEAHHRTLVNTIPDLVWLKDLEGIYISCNQAFERFFGAKESEIVGKTDYDFKEKEQADFFREHDRKAMDDGGPSVNEEWLTFADSGYHGLFETIKTPMRDADGKLIGVLGIARDISGRKKAEEALKENEQRYKKAQRMGHVGNWEYDLVTAKFWGSDEAKRIYGFDPESKDFTTEEVENCIPDRERVHQALVDLIERDKPYNLEFAVQPVDGSARKIIKSIAEVIKDDAGAPVKVSGVVHDITQQKDAEKEKIILERRLKQSQKMESIGNLAGGIAHDFNNILSSIIGFTELAFEEVEKNTDIDDYLQEVFRAGKRARDLVRQILAFARQSEEEIKPILVGQIAREVVKFIRSSIPATIEIRQNITSNSMVMGNATQMHQVLMNLYTNAAHAMDQAGGILEVTVQDAALKNGFKIKGIDLKPGNYIEIRISDTGTGIAPDIIDSIFEPYFTTKAPGEGTGMGLAMVHGIIESYGGNIFVDSQLGKGTVFTIYLPTTRTSEASIPYAPEILPSGSERILFVDDEAPIARMGGQILERLGYSVTTRTSSIEALELFSARPDDFDLVITDMTMPNMTGDKLAMELMEIRPGIPVIICSGYSNKISDQTAAEIGIRGFAYKPVGKADMAKLVRKVLDGKE